MTIYPITAAAFRPRGRLTLSRGDRMIFGGSLWAFGWGLFGAVGPDWSGMASLVTALAGLVVAVTHLIELRAKARPPAKKPRPSPPPCARPRGER